MTDYLLQRDGSCCTIFALANALRFWGRPSPEPGMDEWERLIDIARCRNGSTIDQDGVAEALGLRLEKIPVEDLASHLPYFLTVLNPCRGMTLHAALVIGVEADGFRMVNYRTNTGPVVEVARPEMCDPGNQNRRGWAIHLL